MSSTFRALSSPAPEAHQLSEFFAHGSRTNQLEARLTGKITPSDLAVSVEVLGRYSNLCDQGERLRHLLGIVPEGSVEVNVPTQKQAQHRLEPPEIDRLGRAYESGATVRELAQDFRIHRTTAMDLLERAGVPRRGKGLSDSKLQRAIRLYREGQSTARIGEALGFSAEMIRQHLLASGVRVRGPHDWRRKSRS
jgi:hypothetical protein